MTKNKEKLVTFFILLFLLLLGANFVSALEVNYPRLPGVVPPQDFINTALQEDVLSLYVQYFVTLAIFLGGILALVGLIYAGLKYLTSTGKPEQMASAKDQVTAAVLGLLLLLSSFVILRTINPDLVELKIPTLTTFEIPEPSILPEIGKETQTSIDVEMPFGRIIEGIFETYDFTNRPDERDDDYVPRMERITNLVESILSNTEEDKKEGIADKLLKQSEDLTSTSNSCRCEQTRPCCEDPDPGPGCIDNACYSKPGTTNDPCLNVRGRIQSIEEDNKTEIDNLIAKNIEIEEEVRLLKEQIERLKRSDKFILECPRRSLTSWAQLTSKRDGFENREDILRDTKFWDDVAIRYYPEKYPFFSFSASIFTDYASFYCSVSGTAEQEETFTMFFPDENLLNADQTVEEAEEAFSESMSCPREAPVGEVTDRAKRTAQLLVDKLEELIELDRILIEALDNLQVLISQCSSQRCFSFCIYVSHKGCVIREAQNSPQYAEGACPRASIREKLDEIKNIWTVIRDVIEGREDKDTPATIGITSIIDEIAPQIVEDLDRTVREPMRTCISEDWNNKDTVLFTTEYAKGAIIPGGKKLNSSCRTMNDSGESTIYGDCFAECYLEEGQERHRQCVQECLDGLSVMLNDPDVKECVHELNFYCCNVK